MSNVRLTFEILELGRGTRTEQTTSSVVRIGRLPSADLCIDDPSISDMHAAFEVRSDGTVTVTDLDSDKGTWLSGKRVTSTTFRDNADFVLGQVRVRVKAVAQADEAADVASGTLTGAPAATASSNGAEHAPGKAPDEVTVVGRAPNADASSEATVVRPAPSEALAAAAGASPSGAARSKWVDEVTRRAPANIFRAEADESRAIKPTQEMMSASTVPAAPRNYDAPSMRAMGGSAPGVPVPFTMTETVQVNDGEPQYRMIANGPAVPASDVETAEDSVEVVILWGQNVLKVDNLTPPRTYYVGEDEGDKKHPGVDYLMSFPGAHSVERMPVVVGGQGSVAAVVPAGSNGYVRIGENQVAVNHLDASGLAQPCGEFPDARQVRLRLGDEAVIHYEGFTFRTRVVAAGKPIGIGANPHFDWREHIWTGVSFLFHILFLLTMYFLPPSPSSLALDSLDMDSRLVDFLLESEALEETPAWLKGTGEQGGTGEKHKGDEGAMGKESAKKSTKKYGIKGPEDNKDPHMARENALQEARTAGILGVLAGASGSMDAPTSEFGRDTALGNDPMSALGALMGDQIGENFGFGGLGVSGRGRGGGGTGEGTIGLGKLGTIGHGAGEGSGSGYGRGAGHLGGRSSKVPQIRAEAAEVRGSLSKEVIRRVVRRHLNEVRFCYEQELNQRPDLSGRVTVQFIISPSGAVQSSSLASSTLGSPKAEQCIVQAVRRWAFPSPEGGGVVVVNYPFMLEATGG